MGVEPIRDGLAGTRRSRPAPRPSRKAVSLFGWFKKKPAAKPRPAARTAPAREATPARFTEATESVRETAWITLLLRSAPLADAAGLEQLIEAGKLRQFGFTATREGRVRRGAVELPIAWSQRPYPGEGLDRRFAPRLTDLGEGYLSVGSSVAGAGLEARLAGEAGHPDPWGPEGVLRATTVFAAALLDSGLAIGVIVHRAGDVLYEAPAWLGRLGDPLNPAHRDLGPWVDLSVDDTRMLLRGLDVMDLPAVAVPSSGGAGAEAHDRASEAVLFAAKTMAEENRLLSDGEELRVPLGIAVGSAPMREQNPGLDRSQAVRYRVKRAATALVELEPLEEVPRLASLWAASTGGGEQISYAAYRDLFLQGLRGSGCRDLANMRFEDISPALPAHEVFVMAMPQGGFLMTTCGIGRVAQPNGRPEDGSAFLELAVAGPGHHPAIGHTLSLIGRLIHGRGPDANPIMSSHRITFEDPLPPLGVHAVALGALGVVSPGEGPPIALVCPVVMTPDEVAEIAPEGVGEWIEQRGTTPEVQGRLFELVQRAMQKGQ